METTVGGETEHSREDDFCCLSYTSHTSMAEQTVPVGFCSSYKRGPYAAFSQFYTEVKSVTSGNCPLLLTGVRQETQADSSNVVTYPHPADTSAVFTP